MGFRVPMSSVPENRPSDTPTPPQPLSVEKLEAPPTQPVEAVGAIREPAADDRISQSMLDEVNGKAVRKTEPADQIPQSALDEINVPGERLDPLYPAKVMARTVDPKQTQNILDLSEKLKVSPEQANALLSSHPMDELKAIPELKNIDVDYPGVATWARNPENYKLLIKDPVFIKKMEERKKQLNNDDNAFERYAKDAYKSVMGAISSSINAPLSRSLSLAYEIAAIPQNLIVKALGRPDLEVSAPKWTSDNKLSRYYDQQAKAYPVEGLDADIIDSIKTKAKAGKYADIGRELSLRLLQNPSHVISVAGAMSGYGTAALLGMGYLQGTSTLKESKDKGAAPSASALNALYAGSAEVIFEKLEITGIFDIWRKALAKEIGKEGAKKAVREVIKASAKAFAVEGVGEAATSYAQDASSVATGVDANAMEGSNKRALGAGVLGGFSGATITSIGGALNASLEAKQNKKLAAEIHGAVKALHAKEIMGQMREEKLASDIPKSHPQQTQELLDEDGTPKEDANGLPKRKAFVQFNIREFEELAASMGRSGNSVATELGPQAAERYLEAKDNGHTHFMTDQSEYYRYADDLPELDGIMYVNGEVQNATKAEEYLKENQKQREEIQNTQQSFKTVVDGEGGEEDNSPGPTEFFESEDPQDGDPVLRPIVLLQAGRSADEKNVFRKLKHTITRSLDVANLSPEMADMMAEIQFRHTRFRSEQLGISITETADQLAVGFKKSLGTNSNTIAYFQPGRNGLGMPRSKIIFGSRAKANAVIHEFAHSWLHNMSLDYDIVNAIENKTVNQQDYLDAMSATANLMGLENIGQLYKVSQAEQTKIHETFAQTAEKYFHEGNFEDSRLRKIFEGMRKWMASVASIIGKAYPQYPPLEISPEVSRIFQTITEGNSLVEEEMQKMFQDPLFNPDMLGDKAASYTNALKEARDQAIAKMYAGFYNKSNKERESAIMAAQNDIYVQAEAEVEEMPSIILMRKILAGGEEYRITHQSILDVLARGDLEVMKGIRNSVPLKIIAGQKKIGIDVREIMKYMGINNAQDMIDTLREMGERDALIDDLANEKINHQFPVMKSDDEIHAVAVDAINNAGREKVLQIELEILASEYLRTLQKMSGTVALPPQMMSRKILANLKRQGMDMVNKAAVLSFKPEDFMKASVRHGKNAADFLKKGDFENAFWEKQQEAVNYHAYRAAQVEYSRINKTTARIKSILASKNFEMGKRYDVDYIGYAQTLIRALNEGRGLPELNVDDFQNQNLLDGSRVEYINGKIRAVNTAMVGVDSKNMSVEVFNTFGEALSMVMHTASTSKKIEIANLKAATEEVSEAITSEVGFRKLNDPTTSMTKGLRAKWGSSLINTRTLLSGLFETEAEWARSILAKLHQAASIAEAKFIKEKNADEQVLSAAVSRIARNNPDMQGVLAPVVKRFVSFTKGESGKPIPGSEIDYMFKNEGEIHQMMLYMGSESGRIKFAMGGVIQEQGKSGPLGYFDPETGNFETPEIDAMIERFIRDGVITKDHFDFYQTVWNIYDRHYDEVRKSIRKVWGYETGYVEPKIINTPWGEYRGGYVPLAKDKAFRDISKNALEFSVDNPGTFVKNLFPVTNTSMSKERENAHYPLSLDLSTLRSQLNAVYRVAYMAPTMFDLSKVLNNEEFRISLEARRPGAMGAVIKPWFDRVMAQQYSVPSESEGGKALDVLIGKLRKNNRILAFAANVSTWAKQYIGLIPANTIVDTRYMLRAAAEVGFSPSKAIAEISKSSPRMAQRFTDNERRAVRSFEDFSLHEDWAQKFGDKIELLTYAPIQWAQNHVDAIVFYAAMDQAAKMGMSEPQQINDYAADVVERTQMSSHISSRPGIMHGGEGKRLFTDFSSVFLAMFGINYEAKMRNLDQPTLNKVKAQAYALVLTALIPSIIGTLIGSPLKAIKAGDDDEEEEYLKDMAASVAAESIEVKLPIAGRNALALFDIGGNVGVMPATRSLKQIPRAAKAFNPFNSDHELTFKDYKALLDAITISTGIPTSVLGRGFKTVIDLSELRD